MSSSEPKLLVHLRFEAISGGKVLDASGQGRDGVVHGNPKVVPDDRLGSCLDFGGNEAIELPQSCFPGGVGVTVSFWAAGGLATRDACVFEARDMASVASNDFWAWVLFKPPAVAFYCGFPGELISRAVTVDA